jgi:hypothetical protein
MKWMWMEGLMEYFKASSWDLTGGTEENYDNLYGEPDSWCRL